MSNTYGVTPQGFFPKPLSQIVQDFADAQTAPGTGIDPALDTSPAQPVGRLNGIYANALAEVWELALTAYDTFSREKSQGAALDNTGALTGTLRLAPKPSTVYCVVNAAPGTYAAGTLVASVGGGPDLPFGALQASVGQLFSNAQDITVPALPLNSRAATGLDNVLFASLEDGPIVCPTGWLTTIALPVTGFTAITNAPNDAILGKLLESDTAYKLRQEKELAADGACTVDALTAALLNVPGVKAATILDNPSGAFADFHGAVTPPIPPHSFEVVVQLSASASLDAVARTIWDNRPAGVQSFGNGTQPPAGQGTIPVTVLDSQGNPQSVDFSVVTHTQVYLAYVVTFDRALSPLDKYNVGFELAQTAAQLSQGLSFAGAPLEPATPGVLSPGGPVIALAYRRIALGVAGIADLQRLALDTAPLAGAGYPWAGKDGTIPGALTTVSARTDDARILGTSIGVISLEDASGAPAILVFDSASMIAAPVWSAGMVPPS
jgi:hypothetical protein